MIKLNITSNEFTCILSELVKTIDMRPINENIFDAKVNILRQFDHDEFIYLLNGLKNKKLMTSSSEWFQAIQYLYNNNEFQFINEISKIPSFDTESKLEFIENKVKEILVPFDAAIKRYSQMIGITFFGASISLMLCFFVFYGFTWWWKAPLYTIASLGIYLIFMNVMGLIFVKIIAHSFCKSFLNIFPTYHIDYQQAIRTLMELIIEKLEDNRNLVEKTSYRTLYRKIEKSFVLLNDSEIKNQIEKIIIPFEMVRQHFLFVWSSVVLLSTGIVIFLSYYFYFSNFSWTTALFCTVVSFILMIVLLRLVSNIVIKIIISYLRRYFFHLFASTYSNYQNTLNILRELKNNFRYHVTIELLFKAFGIKIDYMPLSNDEIKNQIQAILDKFKVLLILGQLFWFIVFFLFMSLISCYFIFDNFKWWQTLIYAIGLPISTIILLHLVSYIIGNTITKRIFWLILSVTIYYFVFFSFSWWLALLYTISTSLLLFFIPAFISKITNNYIYGEFIRLFPKNSSDYPQAINILEKLKEQELLEHENTLKVAAQLYNILEIIPENLKDKLAVILKNNFFVLFSITISIVIILELALLYEITWWKIIIYILIFPLLTFFFNSLLAVAAQQDDPLATQLLHEQRYAHNNAWYIGKKWYVEMIYAVLWAYQKKSQHFWKQKKWQQARKKFEIVLATLQLLIDKKLNVDNKSPKLIQRVIPKLSNKLCSELAETRMYIGICSHLVGELQTAQSYLENSLKEYQILIKNKENRQLWENVARTDFHFGICLFQQGCLSTAQEQLENSLEKYQVLIDKGFIEFNNEVAELQLWIALVNYLRGESLELELVKGLEKKLDDHQTLFKQPHIELQEFLPLARGYLANSFLSFGILSTAQNNLQLQKIEMHQSFFKEWLKQDPQWETLFSGIQDNNLDEYIYLSKKTGAELLAQSLLPNLKPSGAYFTKQEYEGFLKDFPHAKEVLEPLVIYDVKEKIYQKNKKLLEQLKTIKETLTFKKFLADCEDQIYIDLAKIPNKQRKSLEDMGIISEIRKRSLNNSFEIILNSEREKKLAKEREKISRMCMAIQLMKMGFFELAQKEFERNIREYRTLIKNGYSELRLELITIYFTLIECLLEKESPDLHYVEKIVSQAFKLLKEINHEEQVSSVTIKMATLIAKWYAHPKHPIEQNVIKAFQVASLGLNWLESVLIQVSKQATAKLIEQNLDIYQLTIDLALKLSLSESAYITLERSKTRVLVEQMLREQIEPQSTNISPEIRQNYRKLREQLNFLEWQAMPNQSLASSAIISGGKSDEIRFSRNLYSPTTEQYSSKIKELQTVRKAFTQLLKDIAIYDLAFTQLLQPKPLTRKQFTPLLKLNELVIAFEQRPEQLRLYPITKRYGVGSPLTVNLSLQKVNEQIKIFQAGIVEGKNLRKRQKIFSELKKWLDKYLNEPFIELITQFNSDEIILIPHISWHLLPIHLVNVNNEFLGICYPIHYLPSLHVLWLISERPPANQKKGCIIANPTKDLKSAKQEGNTVYQIREQTDQLLVGEEAKLTTVRQVLNGSQHSHFSCHGSFHPSLIEAGLYMADGKLSALEMFTSIRMDNPRLVVMSACETAQIQPTLSDEYMGLSSSFLFAGAHNVLSTLWRVEDNATRLLIENFYQNLQQGLSAVKALQQAQMQLRDMTKAEAKKRLPDVVQAYEKPYASPYYWAGFVLIGDGQ